jgi:hypothetical protein
MAQGEGADWEIIPPKEVAESGSIAVEVTVADGSPQTGSVQIQTGNNATADDIASMVADAWNQQEPIEDVSAAAQDNVTVFTLTGSLAEDEITGMAVTFPGQQKIELGAPDPEYGAWASWEAGSLRVRRKSVS